MAVITLVKLTLQQHWLVGLFFALLYLVAGMGVREHSTAAAVCAATLSGLDIVSAIVERRFPGILAICFFALLLANIRGTWMASKWAKAGIEPSELPTRFNETWRDRLVDVWPARIWPRVRVLFFGVFGLALTVSVLGLIAIAREGRRTQPPHHPTYTLDVRPQNG